MLRPRAAQRCTSARIATAEQANARSWRENGRRADRDVTDGRRSRVYPAEARQANGATAAAGRGEAAQLECRRNVHRAIQRATDDRPEQGDARARTGRGAGGTGALGLGQALGVGGEQRDHASRERGGERGAKRQPAQRAQQLVGVHREARERRDEDQQRDLQPDHRAIHRRLDREVALTERAEVAEAREHGQPVAGDEHVDGDDRHDDDRGGAQGARQLAADSGAVARAEHGERQREQDQRMEQQQRGRGQRERPDRAHARLARRAAGSRDDGRRTVASERT